MKGGVHVAQPDAGPALAQHQQLGHYVADAEGALALQMGAVDDELGAGLVNLPAQDAGQLGGIHHVEVDVGKGGSGGAVGRDGGGYV